MIEWKVYEDGGGGSGGGVLQDRWLMGTGSQCTMLTSWVYLLEKPLSQCGKSLINSNYRRFYS